MGRRFVYGIELVYRASCSFLRLLRQPALVGLLYIESMLKLRAILQASGSLYHGSRNDTGLYVAVSGN